ncbi:MAG: hypothetical protein ABSF43_00765 [Rectinemataceae bacterium]|jgi:hypothetical protein
MLAREDTSARKRTALGSLFLLAALALGFLALFVLHPERGRSWWSGFRAVLVDVAIPESEVISRLSAAGAKDILSESTEPVLISNWSGLETMPLSAVRALLVPGDPRLDEYLRRIGLWFEGHAGGVVYRAYYLKEASTFASGASLERVLERGLAGYKGRYIMVDNAVSKTPSDINSLYAAVAVVLLIVAGSVGPLIGRAVSSPHGPISRRLGARKLGRIAFRLFLLLPWALLAGGGQSAAALAALWGFAIAEAADKFDLPLDEFRRNGGIKVVLASLRLQGPPAMALPVVALLASLAAPSLIPSIGLALLGSLMAFSSYVLLAARRSARRYFIPLPVGGRTFFARRTTLVAGNTRAVLASAVIIAWGLCRFVAVPLGPLLPSDFALPKPDAIGGSLRPLLSESRLRASSEGGDVLPGLASYLEHRAIQEALPYVRVGEGRSDPFAPARLPLPHGSPVASATTVAKVQGIDFSDDWARTTYASVPPLSVEGMLLCQGSATVVRIGSGGGRSGRPLAPIEYLLYIFLLVPPLGKLLSGVPFARDAASSERRQEA